MPQSIKHSDIVKNLSLSNFSIDKDKTQFKAFVVYGEILHFMYL